MSFNFYSQTYSITAADMDQQYCMTPAAVLLYYQDSWARFMGLNGFASFDVVKRQRMWVITEFHCNFVTDAEHFVPVFWSDEIEVKVWDSEATPLRIYSDFRLSKHGSVVAQGYACWNLLNTESKRIERCDEMQGMPQIIPDLTIGEHRKQRYIDDGPVINTTTHIVNQLDLDFNGHVNNRSYLSMAAISAPAGYFAGKILRQMDIQWLHETFYGDSIRCELRQIGDGEYINLLYNAENKCVAKIHTVWQAQPREIDIASELERR